MDVGPNNVCQCSAGFIPESGSCVINCSGIANSQRNSAGNECVCNFGYTSSAGTCVSLNCTDSQIISNGQCVECAQD